MTASARFDGILPRVRHNDYAVLQVPKIGEWEPRLSVSVVIPAYGGQPKLDLTLASLAAQSYPSHLLEVVVADDGSTPPLRLPEIAPDNVRIVRGAGEKWGRAHACRTGASAAEGEIIHWLDADMVVFREHVEAQLRWHHLADYLVVLGYKRFVDFTEGAALSPREAFEAVAEGSAGKLFDFEQSRPHDWVEEMINKTNGLRSHGSRSFRAHVGATASVRAELLRAAGGMDDSLVLGEDVELGFRLAQQGAVFVPDPEARSWHLGRSAVMRSQERVNRHNEPYLSHRMPFNRDWRQWGGRQWLVPCVDMVVQAQGQPYEDVRAAVAAALASTLPDVGVSIVGPWSELGDERRSALNDPLLDLRLIQAAFAHDGRVRFVERSPETSAPSPFRFTCPAGWAPTFDGIERLFQLAETKDYGLISLALPVGADLKVGRFERTTAVARAMAVRQDDEKLDDLIDEIYGSLWIDGSEWALIPVAEAVPISLRTEEVLKWKRQAERWEAEAARLKKKVQQPIKRKLVEAGRRRISRVKQG